MIQDVMGNTVNVGDAKKGFLLVRIGSDSRPATMQDIKEADESFRAKKFESLEGVDILITHHNFECEWVPTLDSEEQYHIQTRCLERIRKILSGAGIRWTAFDDALRELEISIRGGVVSTEIGECID